jgi:hypothetical protein
MSCAHHDRGSAELYFYGEMTGPSREAFLAHLDRCAACRAALEDLETIRRVLTSRRDAASPSGGDWDAFMRRLDARLDREAPAGAAGRWPWRLALRIAATVAIAIGGMIAGFQWQRTRAPQPAPSAPTAAAPREVWPTPAEALTTVTDRHLERSKLVLLGLSAKDPRAARPGDWNYERALASTLVADTTQYRLAAADQGRSDLVDVLGDLETVLLQASLGDDEDPRALERLQRLIERRDLLTKIEIMNSESPVRRASDLGVAGPGHEGRSRGNK